MEGVRARASYGPETHAQAANLIAHHVPIHRSTILLAQLAGISVSTGWMAGVRGKAAALVSASGFMEHIASLLKTAQAIHVDETPARAGGGTRYVHLACTRYLTHLHTGDRRAVTRSIPVVSCPDIRGSSSATDTRVMSI